MTNDMPSARNEIFGPAAVILKVDGDELAIRVANGAAISGLMNP